MNIDEEDECMSRRNMTDRMEKIDGWPVEEGSIWIRRRINRFIDSKSVPEIPFIFVIHLELTAIRSGRYIAGYWYAQCIHTAYLLRVAYALTLLFIVTPCLKTVECFPYLMLYIWVVALKSESCWGVCILSISISPFPSPTSLYPICTRLFQARESHRILWFRDLSEVIKRIDALSSFFVMRNLELGLWLLFRPSKYYCHFFVHGMKNSIIKSFPLSKFKFGHGSYIFWCSNTWFINGRSMDNPI